jgi:tRNA (guanosine-2'-O-)-methyltransferase
MSDDTHAAADAMAVLLDRAQRGPDATADGLHLGGRTWTPAEVTAALAPYLTDRRRARIDAVLAGRTYGVATVVEGLVNTGNVSAVMRTAEALGIQPFHIITHDATFKQSERTSQGAEKWLDVHVWDTAADCARHLRERGYQIVATHLDATAVPIDAIDFTQRTALVFGNERDGVTPDLLALSDRRCIIPTPGFTQSFNISVAAAIVLYHARQDRRTRLGPDADLSDDQREALRALWYVKSVKHADQLLRREEGRATRDGD